MGWKRVVQGVLNRAGYDIVRTKQPVHAAFDLLGLLIRDYLSRHQRCVFIQIGANDGSANDPLQASIRAAPALSGLALEPIPHLFAALQRTYADCPRVICLPYAVSDTDGERPMYCIRENAPLPPAVQQLASFDRHNLSEARHGIPDLDRYVETVMVPTRTLTSLLREHHIPSLDLLLTDTEGYDGQIVQGVLDAGLRPPLLIYESILLPPAEQHALLSRLKGEGYRFLEVGLDTYAVRTDAEVDRS